MPPHGVRMHVAEVVDVRYVQTGGVAYLAHVGGFITGLIVGLMFRLGGRGGRTPQYVR